MTSVSLPSVTATLAALLMEAFCEPFSGEIVICALEVFCSAASSTW